MDKHGNPWITPPLIETWGREKHTCCPDGNGGPIFALASHDCPTVIPSTLIARHPSMVRDSLPFRRIRCNKCTGENSSCAVCNGTSSPSTAIAQRRCDPKLSDSFVISFLTPHAKSRPFCCVLPKCSCQEPRRCSGPNSVSVKTFWLFPTNHIPVQPTFDNSNARFQLCPLFEIEQTTFTMLPALRPIQQRKEKIAIGDQCGHDPSKK
mmetsp:Transcript_2585/g.16793  ORF Transcript_2585/g.16793 Transcript_2585/m.16793 type:complete len:208 (+) Transcript_2585:60-683(+)